MNKELEDTLSSSLRWAQDEVIGLFRPKFYPKDEFIPVIENNDGLLTCIEIGRLLGLQTLHIGSDQGKYIPFPDAKSLSDMMQDPIEFNEWYKENCK